MTLMDSHLQELKASNGVGESVTTTAAIYKMLDQIKAVKGAVITLFI